MLDTVWYYLGYELDDSKKLKKECKKLVKQRIEEFETLQEEQKKDKYEEIKGELSDMIKKRIIK